VTRKKTPSNFHVI